MFILFTSHKKIYLSNSVATVEMRDNAKKVFLCNVAFHNFATFYTFTSKKLRAGRTPLVVLDIIYNDEIGRALRTEFERVCDRELLYRINIFNQILLTGN